MSKYILGYIASAFFFIFLTILAQSDDKDKITIDQLKYAMENDSTLVILDVRTPEELEGPLGQIEGVLNIPVQVLTDKLDELEEYKEYNIAVICRSGRRSARATTLLNQKGFKAQNVLGGMIAFRQSENQE